MLALTRKVGESIIIGDQIEVVIVEVKGDQVRLGIKAPREISVYRKEIYQEVQKENITAFESAGNLDLEKVLSKAAKLKKR